MPKRKDPPGRPDGEDPTTTLDDKYNGNDPTADVKVITSDMVEFRVQKHYLLTTSKGFRELLQQQSGSTTSSNSIPSITLVDPDFEDSKTVRTFLDWIHGDWTPKLDELDTVQGIDLISCLLSLLDKWQCTPHFRSSLLYFIPHLIPRSPKLSDCDHYVLFAFTLVAKAQCDKATLVMFCEWRAVLRYNRDGIEKDIRVDSEPPAGTSNAGTAAPPRSDYMLNPAFMPPRYLQQIPPRYIYALSKVYSKATLDTIRAKKWTMKSFQVLEICDAALKRWDAEQTDSGTYMRCRPSSST